MPGQGAGRGPWGLASSDTRRRIARVKERKKERPTPVARRALRGPLQAGATEGWVARVRTCAMG
jgi:hypothetical protein